MQYFIDITISDPKLGAPELDMLGMRANDGREVEVAAADPEAGDTLTKFYDPRTYGPPEFWVYDGEATWPFIQEVMGTDAEVRNRDLKSYAEECGNPTLPARPAGALPGARWTQDVWGFLSRYAGHELEQEPEEEVPAAPRPGGPAPSSAVKK